MHFCTDVTYMPTSNVNGSFPAKVDVDFQFCLNGDIFKRTKPKFQKRISTMPVSSQKNDDNCLNPSNDFDGSV